MLIYHLIFSILSVLAFLEQFTNINCKTKKIFVTVTLFIFIFLSTIYCGSIGDYFTYKTHFDVLSPKIRFNSTFIIQLLSGNFEPLYELASSIAKTFTEHYWGFRLLLAVLVMCFWGKIYRQIHNSMIRKNMLTILLSMWALNSGPIFIVRSTVAISICIYSLRYIETQNKKKFVYYTILAMGFHTMAIVWFMAYNIYWEWQTRKLLNMCAITTILIILLHNTLSQLVLSIAPFLPQRIDERFTGYISTGATSTYGVGYSYTTIVIKGIFNVIVLVIIFYYLYIRLKKSRNTIDSDMYSRFDGYYKLYIFGTMLYTISLPINMTFARAALPFTTLSVFLLPCLFNLPEIRRDFSNRVCVFLFYYIYLFSRMESTLNGLPMDFETIFTK